MDPEVTPLEIKQFIVRALDLEDTNPEAIGDEEPLFAGGLGLDSIDAFELGIALKKKYNLKVDGDDSGLREHFRNVSTLARFVTSRRQPNP